MEHINEAFYSFFLHNLAVSLFFFAHFPCTCAENAIPLHTESVTVQKTMHLFRHRRDYKFKLIDYVNGMSKF